MNDYDDVSQQQAMLQEHEEWLEELARDVVARAEYESWLDLIDKETSSESQQSH